MSGNFVERVLQFTFSGAQSGSFTASGLRAFANIQGAQGRLGTNAMVKIWGLSLAQMNAYSSKLPSVELGQFNLVISAGDMGGQLSEVVNANIYSSYIDLTSVPDSAFVVAVAGIYTGANPGPPGPPAPGAQNAEDLIQGICASAGFTFNNNGAHAVLNNQSVYGSALDQIERIADAAGFAWSWSGTTFSIWPEDGAVDSTVVQIGPGTNPPLIGYPRYWQQGIIASSLWNPQVRLGRQMQVVGSSLTKANGTWQIIGVQHELSTMLDNGSWFTTAVLSAPAS